MTAGADGPSPPKRAQTTDEVPCQACRPSQSVLQSANASRTPPSYRRRRCPFRLPERRRRRAIPPPDLSWLRLADSRPVVSSSFPVLLLVVPTVPCLPRWTQDGRSGARSASLRTAGGGGEGGQPFVHDAAAAARRSLRAVVVVGDQYRESFRLTGRARASLLINFRKLVNGYDN